MWGHFNGGILEVGDEVCWKKKVKRSNTNTWWWNEEVKEAGIILSRKKNSFKAMFQISTERNKRKYKA